jgi:hypothetical protein
MTPRPPLGILPAYATVLGLSAPVLFPRHCQIHRTNRSQAVSGAHALDVSTLPEIEAGRHGPGYELGVSTTAAAERKLSGRVVKAMDLKSIGKFSRRFEPCGSR